MSTETHILLQVFTQCAENTHAVQKTFNFKFDICNVLIVKPHSMKVININCSMFYQGVVTVLSQDIV